LAQSSREISSCIGGPSYREFIQLVGPAYAETAVQLYQVEQDKRQIEQEEES
jgi:hypothetical protein